MLVLGDMLDTFSEYTIPVGDTEDLETEKIYRKDSSNDDLMKKYDRHVGLVMDLTLELTRAANYVCDHARQSISPSFRLDEGKVSAKSGPNSVGTISTYAVEYHGDERVEIPYPGLEAFVEARKSRDVHFGDG